MEISPEKGVEKMKKLLAMLLALVMALGVTTMAWAKDTSVEAGTEKDLRQALCDAATDGSVTTIKLTANIELNMLYAAPNLPDSTVIQDNETGDTFNRYKTGIHPSEDDPTHWNKKVTDQTDEEKAVYGAYYHMAATDERIARLVVKAGQNVVLDLNGFTIEKNARATHGDWSNVCTDIIGNYGNLTIIDTAGTSGTIKGIGYISCGGAVLHNYAGATMTVGKVNVDGNAAGMAAGTGQYVISNEGTLTIDGTNVYDTATSASLLVVTAGDVTVKGNAILNHPNTKTINAKGGTTTVESATIISDADAIYAKAGTVTVKNVAMQGDGKVVIEETASADLTLPVGTVVENSGTGTVTVNGNAVDSGESYTVPQPPRYYYNSTTTTDTKKDETKGSPKTFDAGVGIYAVSALLSVTGMACVGKKKF